MAVNHESDNTQVEQDNVWQSLEDTPFRGKLVRGPDGKMIPKDQLDAVMEAYEREQFYKNNPGAAEHEAMRQRLKEMEDNPDRFKNFEGEQNIRGAHDRNSEYMNINSGENGMYAGTINNATRKEMARMMHDAEDLQTFEEDDKYKEYIAREREKIGTVYKGRDDFNHRIVARLKRLEQSRPKSEPDTAEQQPDTDSQPSVPVTNPEDDNDDGKNPDSLPDNPVDNDNDENQPPKDNSDKTPELPGPVLGETPLLPGPVKVEIGEINIEKPEQTLVEFDKKELETVEQGLKELQPQLAELYARNRRLIVGSHNRGEFLKIRNKYGKVLDSYLHLKAEGTFNKSNRELSVKLDKKVEELRADIESKLTEFSKSEVGGPYKTQEEVDAEKARLVKEAHQTLTTWFGEETEAIKTQINSDFVDEFIQQEIDLETATTNAIDNGNMYRRFVNKVINNKYLKGALVAAGIAGLAVTGVGLAAGLAAGTMSVSLGFTAGGVASGAIKGALGGFLMSRQNSKNSAVRGFADEEEIRKQIEGIDISKQDAGTANAISWFMKQYSNANRKDWHSGAKKTVLATGLGAFLGGVGSGIHINNVVNTEQTFQQQTGTSPIHTEYNVDANISQVNQPQGTGLYETMRQMGVPKENWDQALKIAYDIEPRYGLSPGSNGVVPGFDGTVGRLAEAYTGPVNTWPDASRAFITEAAEEWARQGLMPSEVITTGGEPIYNTITNVVTDYIPNAFMNFLTRATAVAGAGAIGGAIGGTTTARTNRPSTASRTNRPTPTRANQLGEFTPSTSESYEADPDYDSALVDDLFNEYMSSQAGESAPSTSESYEADPDYDSALVDDLFNEYISNQQAGESAPSTSESYEADPDYDSALVDDLFNEYMSNQAGEANAPEPDFLIPDTLRSAIGDEGADILSSREGYDLDNDGTRFANFWDSLDEQSQQEITNFLINEHPDSESGKALRYWLQRNA